ncbi:light-regulated signal transduction histidine kinase (bacteriophytochrome) [Catalinimonas alkaloidigena]|uniref:sensor histidine kinase n=1 Tax=Catalinimonas alkaloidigena TaxID=1075417 RepID=UPI002404BDBD|nr:HAMP domain-containing sensor histidine kinase [Catalinimonas alkaloidigena]MDF9794820.1 light-regulated signal transduction histidine kinase (bacteriophytochrome) [Catalinimonas alkaloidigena]
MKNFLLSVPDDLPQYHGVLLACYGLSIFTVFFVFYMKFITWPWIMLWIVAGLLLIWISISHFRSEKFHNTFFPFFLSKKGAKKEKVGTHHIDRQYEELQQYSSKLEKKIEERTKHLVDLYQELSLANQDIEIFLYKAYHNFLGPIATIRGICNIALLEKKQQDDYFSKISSVSDNMQTMLEKLLEISHIHDWKLNFESIHLNALFEELKEKSKATLVSSLHLNLLFPEKTYLHADAYLLTTAIYKILQGNTRFWSQNRFSQRDIQVKLKQDESYDIICIQEEHLAIPPETLKNLFTMFYRSSAMPEDHGLEFYTARYALRRMGGDISITSSAEYVTFCLHLPKFSTKRYNDLLAILENEH